MAMVHRLGSPLISTATLKMTALLAAGVMAILAGPTLYAQFVTPKIAAATADDDRGVWKLPPPPRYLIESAGTSTDDKTGSVPRPAAPAAPKAETVLMRPVPQPPASAGLPAPPAAPPPAVAALGASDAPGSLPPNLAAPAAAPIVPPPPAVQAAPEAQPKALAAEPAPRPQPRLVRTTREPSPAPHLHTATATAPEPPHASPAKATAGKPTAPRVAAHVPIPPHHAAAKAAEAEGKPAKSRPGQKLAQAKPMADEAPAPQPAAQPPQSQRIPVISNILDGINSAGQAITNAVPKF